MVNVFNCKQMLTVFNAGFSKKGECLEDSGHDGGEGNFL